MSDDAFRELLRSPLPEPGSAEERRAALWGRFFLAAAVGALLALAVLWLGGGEVVEEAVPTTASTTPVVPVDPVLPAGYTPLDGGRYGVRPERAFTSGATPFLVMSSAVRSDLDPAAVSGFTGGMWSLRHAGGTVTVYVRELRLPESLGVFVIEFPPGTAIEPTATLELLPPLPREEATVETTIDVPALPWSGPLEPVAFPHADGIEVVFDSVEFDSDGGTLSWHIGNRVDATATVTPAVVFGGDSVLVPDWAEPPRFNQLPQPPAPVPAPGGSFVLHRLGDPVDPVTVTSVVLRLDVGWQYHEGEPVEIPLAGIDAVAGG